MKRKLVLSFICLLFAGVAVNARNFAHPGALHTQEDFERIKTQLAANETTVVQGYSNLRNSKYAQSSFVTYPTEIIVRGGGVGENYMNAARGAAAAYQNALMWKISGNEAHARKAIEILNAWASVCKGIGGDSNFALAAGLYGYEFANAAELMRDYQGWRVEDIEKFKEWLLNVWYPSCIDFLKRRNDTWGQGRPGHYWSNWGLCNVIAVMSIGIFCDDVFIYNQGLSYYKYDLVGTYNDDRTPPIVNDGLNEFLGNLVPAIAQDERGPYGYLGQMQESGRDQGHTLMAAGLAADICQIGWNQGDDLFSHMNNRLAAGIEFVAAYNSFAVEAADLPWSEYWYHDVRTALHNAWKQTEMNAGGRGGTRPIWDRVIGHYEGIKGVEMPYSRAASARLGVDAGAGSYGETSGGFDHLGFTSLTCTRPAVSAGKAPTPLAQSIVYNGATYNQGELSNVIAGRTLKFVPELPADETDTGQWQWDNGHTGKDLEIAAQNSTLYRVTYTNGRGIKSTQVFSVAVKGDCTPNKLIPSIMVNGISYNDTIVTVFPRTSVKMTTNTVNSSYGSFKWDDNSAGNTLTVPSVSSNRKFTVTFVNEGGAESKQTFHVNISYLDSYYKIDGGTSQKGAIALIQEGGSVELVPSVYSSATGGTWEWSDGTTNSSLLLENLRKSGDYWVKYTYNEITYKLDYKVQVYSLKYPMTEGDYWIRNPLENSYLTNVGDNTPVFSYKDAENEDSQLFTITKDGERYKMVSKKDGRYVNEHGVFGTNPYYTAWNTYDFHRISETNLYAIQNGGSAGTRYWQINNAAIIGANSNVSELNGFPFEIIPYVSMSVNHPGITASSYSIYPNPVTDYLFVQLSDDVKNATLQIFDMNGKMIKSIVCKNATNEINLIDLAPSIYIGTLVSDKDKTSFKIIKR